MSGKMYRYPGPTPFSRSQELLYHGREEDIDQLFQSVLLNHCTVVVGRSGVGKTSLINAGLLPRIEQEITAAKNDLRFFRIVRLRAYGYDSRQPITLSDRIKACFANSLGPVDEKGLAFLENVPIESKESIGFLLKQYQLSAYYKDNRREIFLIIFDQLEELFTYPAEQVEMLERELAEVISPNMPDSIRFYIEEKLASNPDFLSEGEAAILEVPAAVKFLLAIRSDKLSLLIRLRRAVPDILHHPYELRPFSREQAMRAISLPAKKPDAAFASGPFEFTEQALIKICEYLETLPNSDPETQYERQRIEPLTIQLVCQYIERHVVPGDMDKIIAANEFDISAILTNYYEQALQELRLDNDQHSLLLQVLEEELVYAPDRRRLLQYQEHLTSKFQLSEVVLGQLVELGLLRMVTSTGTKPSYELAHDWLVDAVLEVRNRRTKATHVDAASMERTLLDIKEKIDKAPRDYTLFQQRAGIYASIGDYESAADDYSEAIRLKGKAAPDADLLLQRANVFELSNRKDLAKKDYETILQHDPENCVAHFYIGEWYYNEQQTELAKASFEKCMAIDPTYVNALNYLGIIAVNEDQPEKARQCFEEVLALDQHYKYALSNIGVLHAKEYQWEEAKTWYMEALECDAEYEVAWNNLGEAYEYLGQLNEALHAYSRASAIRPGQVTYRLNVARMLHDLQRYEEAIKETGTVLSQQKDNATAWYLHSLNANQLGDYETALHYARKYTDAQPIATAYYQLGIVYFNMEQHGKALVQFEEALRLRPDHDETLNYMALCQERQGNVAEAESLLLRAKAISPANFRMSYNLGRLYYYADRFDEAQAEMELCLKLRPAYAEAMNYLGLAHKRKGQIEQAAQWFNQALEANPSAAHPCYNAGVLYFEAQQYEQAKTYMERCIQLLPSDVEAHHYMGLIWERLQQYDKAMASYDEALKLKPDYLLIKYNKGVAAYLAGHYQMAERIFTQLTDRDYQPDECLNYLGAIANKQADFAASEEYFKRALSSNEKHEYAGYNLGEAQYLQGKHTEALQSFEAFLLRFPDDEEALAYKAKCLEQEQPEKPESESYK